MVRGQEEAAAEPEVFTVPKAYPIERYEAGWNKNPFTLKTAPTVLEQDSFAKDLAIGAYYGDAKDPTVVVVNTKTGKRMPLKKSQPGSDGIQLKEIKLGTSRKDIVAELTMGAQTAEVKFDSDYVKQLAGTETARAQPGKAPGTPGVPPGQHPGGLPPGQPPKAPGPGGTAAQMPRVGLPPLPGRSQAQPGNAAVAAANRTISPVNQASAGGASGNLPAVTRRRLITPATPVAGTR